MAETQERVLIYDRIDANRRRTWLLLALFAIISLPAAAYVAQYLAFVAGLAVFSFSADDWEIALAAGAVIAVAIVVAGAYFQYRYASAALLRFAGAREVGRDEETVLLRTVENLCIGAGLPQPRVYVVESAAANAFATGLSPDRASLVVTRGLLELLDRRELEGVVAHELVQIGNYDTRLSAIMAAGVGSLRLPFVVVAGLIRFLFRIHWIVGAGVLLYIGLPLLTGVVFSLSLLSDEPEVALLVLIAMTVPVYVLAGAPLLGLLIRGAISRKREFLADADAVLLARHAEGLARALAKMGAARGSRMKVGGATAHLYIVDPLPEDAPWWDRVFGSTHPPIEERIALLGQMGGGIAPSVLRAAEEAGSKFRSVHIPVPVAEATHPDVESPMDENMKPGEVAAPDGPPRHPSAFRLTGAGAVLYERPDNASRRLAELSVGALITVLERRGDFLQILTTDDSFGYISKSTSMAEADIGDSTAV